MATVRLPKPALGTTLIRCRENETETAAVISVRERKNGSWDAVVYSVTLGPERIDDSAHTVGRSNWRMQDWIWYEVGTWGPPDMVFTPFRNTILPPDDLAASDFPPPEPEETFQAWGKRVAEVYPTLGTRGAKAVHAAWSYFHPKPDKPEKK